jgi:hypothetical protein
MSQDEFADRRECPRYVLREGARVSCHQGTMGLGRDMAESSLEISETGTRLRLSEPLERGQVVEVGFCAPGWTEEIKRLGLVMWAKGGWGEECLAGIQFSERLSRDVLRDLCHLSEGM